VRPCVASLKTPSAGHREPRRDELREDERPCCSREGIDARLQSRGIAAQLDVKWLSGAAQARRAGRHQSERRHNLDDAVAQYQSRSRAFWRRASVGCVGGGAHARDHIAVRHDLIANLSLDQPLVKAREYEVSFCQIGSREKCDPWYNGRMYSIAHLVSLARSFSTVATRFLPETRLISVRIRLLRFAGATIEQYAKVIGYQAMTAPEDVFICEADYVNTGCLFLGGASINIKHHAMIGPRTNLVTINHTGENYNDLEFLPVTVEPYAWIGAGVTICPGVTIGHHAAVAAGSVVMRDVAPHTRVAGSPARAMPPKIIASDRERYGTSATSSESS